MRSRAASAAAHTGHTPSMNRGALRSVFAQLGIKTGSALNMRVLTHRVSRVFAYCRVSTGDQTTDNQVREIAGAGFAIEDHRAVRETVSGSQAAQQRPEFARLLDRMEPRDVLVVTKLDRLGRSALDVRATVELLAAKGIRVHCLALGGVDLTSPAGKMTMQVIAAVAEFELDLLKERTHSGLARARAEGKQLGRHAKLNAAQVETIRARLAAGDATVSALALEFSVGRATIQRARGDNVAAAQGVAR